MEPVWIYILMTEDDVPFYVGKTADRVRRRTTHLKTYPGCKFVIIERVADGDRWQERERFWVAYYGFWFTLTNRTRGGNGSGPRSLETRLRLSRALKGRPNLFMKGRKMPPEAVEKTAAARRGRPISQSLKDKISKGLQGHKHSEDTKEKIRQGLAHRVRKAGRFV